MKRIRLIAAVLSLCLTVGLAACAPKAAGGDLTGTWVMTVSASDLASAVITDAMRTDVALFDFGEETARLRLSFDADGGYQMALDDPQELHDRLWVALQTGCVRIFSRIAAEQGTTLEAWLARSGKSAEDLAEHFFSAEKLSQMCAAEGNYRTDRANLYLSDQAGTEPNENFSILYEVKDQQLALIETRGDPAENNSLQKAWERLIPARLIREK